MCAVSHHKACIGIDIGCKCSCHVSEKTLRRDRKVKEALITTRRYGN